MVASGLSGIPELVEDGRSRPAGAPGDAAALADALRRLADDPAALRRRLGSAGREKVLEEFDVRQERCRSWCAASQTVGSAA